jgi:hypothetical protein
MEPAQFIPIEDGADLVSKAASRLDNEASLRGTIITYSMYTNAIDFCLKQQWNDRIKYTAITAPVSITNTKTQSSTTKKDDQLNLIKEFLEQNGIASIIIGMLTLSPFQNIIFSLFFIVIARKYSSTDFSSYIIANTLYGMILSFSSLGLSQWFIREIKKNEFDQEIISRFFKIQILAGMVFYIINVLLSFTLYHSDLIRNISLLLGINIIFDNIIYVFKTITKKYKYFRFNLFFEGCKC